MRFHSSKTVKNTLISQIDFSRAYCPPEVNQNPESIVDQRYDVWTIGCVYLEFITWYFLGYDAVRKDTFRTPSGNELNGFLAMRENDYRHPDDGFFSQSWISTPKVKKSVKRVS
jgi:serine/threonine protein kinase